MTVLFLLTVAATSGQRIPPPALTDSEATLFQQSLDIRIADTTRIDMLLQLATYNILKTGEYKADLDSAATFIQQANDLNAKIRSTKFDGYITLVKSSMVKERGDIITGKELVNKSIALLESANDAFHVALAYIESLSYAEVKNPVQFAEMNVLMPVILSQLQKINDPAQRSDCIDAILHFYQTTLRELDLANKLSFLNHLLFAFRTIKDGPRVAWTRKEVADIHFQQGKTEEAVNELLELLKFQKAGGYPHICFTYDLLSGIYLTTINHKKALYYILETIKSVNSALDSSYLPDFYYRIAGIYRQVGNREQAYYWSMKQIDYQNLIGSIDFYYDISEFIIVHLISINKPAEALSYLLDKKKKYPPKEIEQEKFLALAFARCYKALKNDLLAEKYCQEIMKLRDIERHVTDIITLSFIGTFYLDTRQYDKAQKHLGILLNELPPSAGTYRTLYTSRYMSEIDSARGNYLSAYKHLKKYHQLNDSVFNTTKNKQIEELRISYETDLKADSIKLMDKDISILKQQNDLQKANLKQAVFVKKVTIAGITLAFIIILLLYRQYRLKQRSNKVITHKSELLQHLLNEKEWLLKEIHHRVKNNFQMVMGLLGTQSGYLKSEEAVIAFNDSQNRIQSMSLIHQKLYQSNNLSAINLYDYIHELVDSLSESFNTSNHVRFRFEVERIELDLAHCIPLGLIMNEAITNAFKYAFPANAEGIISIIFNNQSVNQFRLTIEDNGKGLPASFDINKSGSMGMNLMRGLSEEIGARFKIDSQNGTKVTISFEYDCEIETGIPFVNANKAATI